MGDHSVLCRTHDQYHYHPAPSVIDRIITNFEWGSFLSVFQTRNMKKKFILPAARQFILPAPVLTIAAILSLAACTHNPPPPDQIYPKEIEAMITQVETHLCANPTDTNSWTLSNRMKFYQVEGLSIAVIHDFGIQWARGYGWADVSEHRPVTTRTLFQAGSISKSLNAVGILLLVQRHQLDLNTDINDYLKTWKFNYDSVSKGRKITVGNL